MDRDTASELVSELDGWNRWSVSGIQRRNPIEPNDEGVVEVNSTFLPSSRIYEVVATKAMDKHEHGESPPTVAIPITNTSHRLQIDLDTTRDDEHIAIWEARIYGLSGDPLSDDEQHLIDQTKELKHKAGVQSRTAAATIAYHYDSWADIHNAGDDLQRFHGVGPKTVENIREYIRMRKTSVGPTRPLGDNVPTCETF